MTLCEAQQNSGVTYRVWDWNRVGDDGRPRQLHIDKAMEVMRFDEGFNKALKENFQKGTLKDFGAKRLFKHPEFEVELISIKAGDSKELRAKSKDGLSVLGGSLLIDGSGYQKFDSAIIMDDGLIKLEAKEDSSLIFMTNK